MVISFLLFFFKSMAILSAFFLLMSSNPVHSVLFLILVFCNSAGVLILLGAEFLALVFVVVYVGAIAVLFLFVCMMLNVKSEELRHYFLSYFPVTALLGVVIFFQLSSSFSFTLLPVATVSNSFVSWLPGVFASPNMQVIASVLYTEFFLPFNLSGLLLLVAMVGAILLTLSHRLDVRRQAVYSQLTRESQEALHKTS